VNEIEQLEYGCKWLAPAVETRIDPPAAPDGSWFLDITRPDGLHVVVEWRPGRGFGISVPTGDDYGVGPDIVALNVIHAFERLLGLICKGNQAG
jgi:hypothetical protein